MNKYNNKDTVMADKKKVNKRIASTKAYVDTLSENYSKLNVVRVDLAYAKDDNGQVSISLDEANRDFNHMMNNRRGKPSIFKDQVGCIIKKEYTEEKGVHFHAAFFFDGNKVQNDYYKGKQIGEYWKQLTQEKRGSYYNCNQDKKSYKELGIGMLDYRDEDKREILDSKVISYLCKDDHQDIQPIKNNDKDRAFVRGTMPKSKGNLGRPRDSK
jgi:hypothetical protein